MELIVAKPILVRALRLARGVADKAAALEILSNVVLRTSGGRLVVAASDLQVSAVTEAPAIGVGKQGGIAVNAKQVHDLVHSLPDADITLKVDDKLRLSMKSAKSEFKLAGTAHDNFPTIENLQGVSMTDVDSPSLHDMLGKTIHCASQRDDVSSPALASVGYESDGKKTTLFATDTFRLAVVSKDIPGPKFAKPVLIPRKGAQQMRTLIEGREAPCSMGVKDQWLMMKADDSYLVIKKTEAEPFPYAAVLPATAPIQFSVQRADLMSATGRVLMVAKPGAGMFMDISASAIRLSLQGESGDIDEEVEIKGGSKSVRIKMDGKYLRDILAEIEGHSVSFWVNGPVDPIVIKQAEGDYSCLIMPMAQK